MSPDLQHLPLPSSQKRTSTNGLLCPARVDEHLRGAEPGARLRWFHGRFDGARPCGRRRRGHRLHARRRRKRTAMLPPHTRASARVAHAPSPPACVPLARELSRVKRGDESHAIPFLRASSHAAPSCVQRRCVRTAVNGVDEVGWGRNSLCAHTRARFWGLEVLVKASHHAPAPFARSCNYAWLAGCCWSAAQRVGKDTRIYKQPLHVSSCDPAALSHGPCWVHTNAIHPRTLPSPRFPPPPFCSVPCPSSAVPHIIAYC